MTNSRILAQFDPDVKISLDGSTQIATSNRWAQIKVTGSTNYSEMAFLNDVDNYLRLGSIGSAFVSADWADSSYVYSDRKLSLKALTDVNIFAGGHTIANIVATFGGSAITLAKPLLAGGSEIITSTASLQVNGFMRTGNIHVHEGGNTPNSTNKSVSNVSGNLSWDGDILFHESNAPVVYNDSTESIDFIFR